MTPSSLHRRRRRPLLWTALGLLLATLAWAVVPSPAPARPLAADLPPGALMTLESPDFASLLRTWNQSAEQRAWLSSANYSAFTNSHLFSRLADAQSGFANAARVGLDGSFIQQVAGRESIFAWYNIGNLEFLYITHLPHDQAAQLSLLQQRTRFSRRESAGTPFYIRTATGPAPDDSANTDTTDSATSSDTAAANSADTATDTTASDTPAQPRTVAFALRGDWLLLATREDLLAHALQLMASQDAKAAPADSEATEGWFAAADAAGPATHGDLHMLLDLQSLTRTPQFRTYWIQRNVTDTRQYRAAVVDLYRDRTQFREERTLLPLNPAATTDAVPDPAAGPGPATPPDLTALEALVPDHVGTYSARAQPSANLTVATLEQKLFPTTPAPATTPDQAPAEAAALTPTGSSGDLDLRIDAPAPAVQASPGQSLTALQGLLDAARLQASLTLERSSPTSPTDPFVHLHTAVVLRAASPWNAQSFLAALNTALAPRFTTGALGLTWQPAQSPGGAFQQLTGPHPLALYTSGPLAILTNDPALLADILARQAHPLTGTQAASASPPAQLIAAVHLAQERPNFRHLTRQLAQSDSTPTPADATPAAAPDATPVRLFADNLPSLADTFAALATERLLQTQTGPNLHQTVTYTWSQPTTTGR